MAALGPDHLVVTDSRAMGGHHPGRDAGPRRRGAAARRLDPRPAPRPVTDRVPPLRRGHPRPGEPRHRRRGAAARLPMSTWCSASPATTGCCPRRPRRSSPSPAWACSSGRCATNESPRGDLDLDPRRRAGGGPEEPAPDRSGHLDQVALTATRRRSDAPGRPTPRTPARRRRLAPPPGPAGGRGTTMRNVHRTSPLGSTRSSGSAEIRPASRTSLTGSGASAPASRSPSPIVCAACTSPPRVNLRGGSDSHGRHRPPLWTKPRNRSPVDGFWLANSSRKCAKMPGGPPSKGWPSGNVCPAASYSPTASRLQYHWRWQA